MNQQEMTTLAAYQCSACGKLMSTPSLLCIYCYSANVQAAEMAGTGRVYSYTYVSPKNPADTGYTLSYVDVAGLRVLTRNDGRLDLRCDAPVQVASSGDHKFQLVIDHA